MSVNTFLRDWGFPSDVRETIAGAGYYEVMPVPGAYRSGRPRMECVFYSAEPPRTVVARRPAMELTSKGTGLPYHVCQRHEARQTARAEDAAPARYTLDDAIA